MRRFYLPVLAGLFFLLFTEAPLFSHKIPIKGSCPVCGMYIKEFWRTRTEAIFKNGDHYIYCGVACLLRDINQHGGLSSLKEAWVTDWITKKSIPFFKAVYVIGSDIIPDMLPNIIAFASEEEARKFIEKHGGVIKSIRELLNIISPVGLTVPFRIPGAAVPARNVFKVVFGGKDIFKNTIYHGDNDISTGRALRGRKKVVRKMKIIGTAMKIGYGITDNLAVLLTVPRIYKKAYIKLKKGKNKTFTTQGLGDVDITFRYRLWRDTYFDRHFGVLFGVTLPTGEYNTRPHRTPESWALKLGVMYSHHKGPFWFHFAVFDRYYFENSDDFQKGNTLTFGFAAHYTIDYDNVIGFEFDTSVSDRSQYKDRDIRDSGGIVANVNLLVQRKVAKFGGGNLVVRALAGIPIYQKLYGTQLGEDYHFQLGVGWKRRF